MVNENLINNLIEQKTNELNSVNLIEQNNNQNNDDN